MTYALYIDESGNFKDGDCVGGRASLVAGWMAGHDEDHDSLRQELTGWYEQVSKKLQMDEYHATTWRKTSEGRQLLNQVFELVGRQNPYAVFAMENRTCNMQDAADSTYFDMLVELIARALFYLIKNRKSADALSIQVYVAERKGVPESEIRKLVKYRFRALAQGSGLQYDFYSTKLVDIHVRPLKLSAKSLNNPQSMARVKYGLMPELILADFVCNSLFQAPDISSKPDAVGDCRWVMMDFIRDPFWRDIQFLRTCERWVELMVELSSQAGQQWREEHPEMSSGFDELKQEAQCACLKDPIRLRQLIDALDQIIRRKRDWIHAQVLMDGVEACIENVPENLLPLLNWRLARFKLVVANHTGGHAAAAEAFKQFQKMFADSNYQRVEFIHSIPEEYNRYAVSVTDTYDFETAVKILNESIEVEKQFLKHRFQIMGTEFSPLYSDVLGRLYSTLGQFYTKQAFRDPGKADEAVRCYEKAGVHMKESFDQERYNNYLIEAYLHSRRSDKVSRIEKLLTDKRPVSPDDLMANVKPSSFNMVYWMQWILLSENTQGPAYMKVLVEKGKDGYMALDGQRYPEMSILYYFGQMTLRMDKKQLAADAWTKAAAPGMKFDAPGVLQTLALRPLCELAIHFGNQYAGCVKAIQNILKKIKTGSLVSSYFSPHDSICNGADPGPEQLLALRDDIPYS